MRAAHLPAPNVDRRDDDLIRRQPIHQQAHRRHVGDGVHRADLVEVDLLHRHAVRAALRLGNQAVDREDIVLHLLRQVQVPAHDMLNIVQAAVLVMVVLAVVVVMLVRMLMVVFMLVMMAEHLLGLLFAVDSHRHVRAADAAFDRVLADVLHAGDPQRVQFLYKALRIGQQLQQSRRQHVARRAHAAVEIKRSHFVPPMWLIMLAR